MTEFEKIYETYFNDVFLYIRRLSGSEHIAEEITSETFFKALQKLDSFDGKCKVSVWLCQIAKNTYISMCRKEKNADFGADTARMPAPGDLEEGLCNRDTAFRIHKVLHTLEEPYKEVFSLRTFGDLSFRQIGDLFGKTESWARVTYHRARWKIKEEL